MNEIILPTTCLNPRISILPPSLNCEQVSVQSSYFQFVYWVASVIPGRVKSEQQTSKTISFLWYSKIYALKQVTIIWVSKRDKEDDVVYKASRRPPTLRAKRVRLYCRPFIESQRPKYSIWFIILLLLLKGKADVIVFFWLSI